MKNVVIFSCSLKDPKYSTTKAWADLQAKRFLLKGVNAKVINLKDYDYEASKNKDKLHEQLKNIYDADLIMFSSPINISRPTFYLYHLIERFIHAYKKSTNENIDIFKDKFIEYAVLFGTNYEYDFKLKKRIKTIYNQNFKPCWDNHHGYVYSKLSFINHLGIDDLHVSTWSPDEITGPRYVDMDQHDNVVADCDRVVDIFKEKTKNILNSIPKCSLEKFLDFFKSENKNAFGRGYTLSVDDLTEKTVKDHINFVHENVKDIAIKGVIFISMKERCSKIGRYDLSEMYYVEQFKLGKNPNYRIGCSGNYRPNGY